MSLRNLLFFFCVSIAWESGVVLAQTEALATVPAIPESGKEFQVLHLRDVAELQLGAKPTGVKYKWMAMVTQGKLKVTASGAGLPAMPDAPLIKIKRARPDSKYVFTLQKTSGDDKKVSTLVISFGPEGTESTIETSPKPAAQVAKPAKAPPAGSETPEPKPKDEEPAKAPTEPKAGEPKGPAPKPLPSLDGAPAIGTTEALKKSGDPSPTAGFEAAKAADPSGDRFSNAALTKAKADLTNIATHNVPASDPVLSPPTYFLDKFRKEYPVADGKLTLGGTNRKLMVCLAVANAMLEVANQPSNPEPAAEKYQLDWKAREEQLIIELTAPDMFEDTMITARERQAWEQFLVAWREDVMVAAPLRFKDALLQAAHAIAKAGLDIQSAQETEARAQGAFSSTSSAVSGAGGLGSVGGYHPHHERKMNWIYHHHEIQMNRIERIRARR